MHKTKHAVMLSALLFAGLVSSSWATSGQVRAIPDTRTAALEALMNTYARLGEFSGAVLVAEGGRTITNSAYGFADFERKLPNVPEGRFLIGSVTKQFTAVLVLKLIEQGRLSFDSRLADVLPYYRKDTGSRITIRHLLDHTSGIANMPPEAYGVGAVSDRNQFVKKYCSGDLVSVPGTRFAYNNGAYIVLGAVIEQVTGQTYEAFLRQAVLTPLSMTDTDLGRLGASEEKRVAGHQRNGGAVVRVRTDDIEVAFSAGGLCSTTRDLARWERVFYEDGVLSAASRRALESAPANDYTCGLRFARWPVGPGGAERQIVFHGGRIVGFNSLVLRVPSERVLVVLLNNTDSTRLETMARGLLDIVYGRTPAPPRASLATLLHAELQRSNTADAIAHVRKQRGVGPIRDPEPEELQLNDLGYRYVEAKRSREALAVFTFVVELFPKSSNAYDSLAECQAKMGMKDQAIANYKKALELNPNSRSAAEALAKLTQAPRRMPMRNLPM